MQCALLKAQDDFRFLFCNFSGITCVCYLLLRMMSGDIQRLGRPIYDHVSLTNLRDISQANHSHWSNFFSILLKKPIFQKWGVRYLWPIWNWLFYLLLNLPSNTLLAQPQYISNECNKVHELVLIHWLNKISLVVLRTKPIFLGLFSLFSDKSYLSLLNLDSSATDELYYRHTRYARN